MLKNNKMYFKFKSYKKKREFNRLVNSPISEKFYFY